MALIKGVAVVLRERIDSGETDAIGNQIYTFDLVQVENVIVSPSSDTDVTSSLSLYGKKAIYTLSIPKGDTHDWRDAEVVFFGLRFRTIGAGLEYIEELTPLDWNKKISVELIEEVVEDINGQG